MKAVRLEELRGRSLEEVLQEVAERNVALHILLPSGAEIDIEPRRELEPLPTLQGRMPSDWKNHVYSERGD